MNKFPHLLHGADYYPEQWLGRPDILRRDVGLMQEAGIDCVSLGVFAWSSLEPEEGVYGTVQKAVSVSDVCLGPQL